jgi:hypothetical protein
MTESSSRAGADPTSIEATLGLDPTAQQALQQALQIAETLAWASPAKAPFVDAALTLVGFLFGGSQPGTVQQIMQGLQELESALTSFFENYNENQDIQAMLQRVQACSDWISMTTQQLGAFQKLDGQYENMYAMIVGETGVLSVLAGYHDPSEGSLFSTIDALLTAAEFQDSGTAYPDRTHYEFAKAKYFALLSAISLDLSTYLMQINLQTFIRQHFQTDESSPWALQLDVVDTFVQYQNRARFYISMMTPDPASNTSIFPTVLAKRLAGVSGYTNTAGGVPGGVCGGGSYPFNAQTWLGNRCEKISVNGSLQTVGRCGGDAWGLNVPGTLLADPLASSAVQKGLNPYWTVPYGVITENEMPWSCRDRYAPGQQQLDDALNAYKEAIQVNMLSAYTAKTTGGNPVVETWAAMLAVASEGQQPEKPATAPGVMSWTETSAPSGSAWVAPQAMVRYGIYYARKACPDSETAWTDWMTTDSKGNPILSNIPAPSDPANEVLWIKRQFGTGPTPNPTATPIALVGLLRADTGAFPTSFTDTVAAPADEITPMSLAVAMRPAA